MFRNSIVTQCLCLCCLAFCKFRILIFKRKCFNVCELFIQSQHLNLFSSPFFPEQLYLALKAHSLTKTKFRKFLKCKFSALLASVDVVNKLVIQKCVTISFTPIERGKMFFLFFFYHVYFYKMTINCLVVGLYVLLYFCQCILVHSFDLPPRLKNHKRTH